MGSPFPPSPPPMLFGPTGNPLSGGPGGMGMTGMGGPPLLPPMGGGLAGLPGMPGMPPDPGDLKVGPVYPARLLDENGNPRKPRKPTATACQAKATHDERKHGRLVARFLKDLRRYRQKHQGVFEDFDPTIDQEFTSTEASTQVNKVANMGAGLPWRYEVPYRTAAEKKASQRVEAWAAHWVDTWTRMHAARWGTDLRYEMFWYALVLGHLVGRCFCDLDDAGYPWTPELLNPAQTFPTFGGPKDGLTVVTEVYRTTYGDVLETYAAKYAGLERKLLGKQQGDDQTWSHAELDRDRCGKMVTYCDAWWHGAWFDGVEVVPVTAHEYLEVPYVYCRAPGEPGGFASPDRTDVTMREALYGYKPGQDLAGWDTVEQGPSFFHYVENALLQQEAYYGILVTQTKQATNPATVLESDYEEPPEPFDFGPGGNNTLRPGEKLQNIPTSPRPSDVGPLLEKVGAEVAKAMLPDPMFGVASGSQVSGYAEDALRGATRDRTGVYFAMVQRFVGGMLGLAAREFRSFGHLATTDGTYAVPSPRKSAGSAAVGVGEMADLPPEVLLAMAQLGIGPPKDEPEVAVSLEDFDLVGSDVRVKIKQISMQNLTQMMNVVQMALNAPMPVWSWEYGAEQLDVDDPDLMWQQILTNKAMMDPLILKTVLYPKALYKSGNMEAYRAYMDELRMAQQPPQPMGGGQQPPQALPQGVRGPQTAQGDSQPAVDQGPGVGGRPSGPTGGRTDFNPS